MTHFAGIAEKLSRRRESSCREPAFLDLYKGATNEPTIGFALPVYGVQDTNASEALGIALGVRVVGDDLFDCLSGYHPHPLYVVCTHFPE